MLTEPTADLPFILFRPLLIGRKASLQSRQRVDCLLDEISKLRLRLWRWLGLWQNQQAYSRQCRVDLRKRVLRPVLADAIVVRFAILLGIRKRGPLHREPMRELLVADLAPPPCAVAAPHHQPDRKPVLHLMCKPFRLGD